MAVSITDIFFVLEEISKANQDLGATLNESVKGAAAMGGSTFTGALGGSTFTGALGGGLVGGPVGMIVGGAIGFAGGAAYVAANTKSFKPLYQVMREMTDEEKRRLVKAAEVILQKKGIDIARQIVGDYGSEFARNFLIDVYGEFSGKTSGKTIGKPGNILLF